MNYYNEHDKFAAEWLENLIKEGLIPDGKVDRRSIADVQANDVRGFTQCHFFAGIGGWPLALQLAGWGPDRPVWTGSCPCQPFSQAGKQKAQADERHLWPEMFRLIRECKPETVIGEQVASSDVVGSRLEADFIIAVQAGDFARANKIAKRLVTSSNFHFHRRWLDGIQHDLESEDYAMRCKVLGAFSVISPHKRSRLYWVANSGSVKRKRENVESRNRDATEGGRKADWAGGGGASDGVADSGGERKDGPGDIGVEKSEGIWRDQPATGSDADSMGNAILQGPQGQSGNGNNGDESRRIDARQTRSAAASGAWTDYRIIHCLDGNSRRVGCGVLPLVNGIPRSMGQGKPELSRLAKCARGNRVGRLKGYGNAIVPQVAAEFVAAFMDCKPN